MLFLCVAATYWKVLKYPFIQDDWGILFSIVEMDDFEIVQQAFLPEGKLFYRPLGITYFVLAHLFFGLNSLGYHLLALGLHFVNSLLVVRISGLFLQGNKLLPWLAGILYGTAIAVHMDPLLWIVGIYDLACAFFFFSSFILFTKQRHIQSAWVLALAMLFKKSAVVLIPILFLYNLLLTGGTSRRALLTKLTPFMLVLLAFLYLRIQMISPWSLPSTHPYRTLFWGQHLLNNLLSYSKWAAEARFAIHRCYNCKTGMDCRVLGNGLASFSVGRESCQEAYLHLLSYFWQPSLPWDWLLTCPHETSPPSKLDSEPFEVHSKG